MNLTRYSEANVSHNSMVIWPELALTLCSLVTRCFVLQMYHHHSQLFLFQGFHEQLGSLRAI